jgi:hypothetical protein
VPSPTPHLPHIHISKSRATRTENGIARTPDGGEGAWFKDSEGNLVGVVRALPG